MYTLFQGISQYCEVHIVEKQVYMKYFMIICGGPWKDAQQYVFYNINIHVPAENQVYYAVF